jgi:hypothetical protein
MRLAEIHADQQLLGESQMLGHNQPSPADLSADTMRDLSAWMAEHPVIQDGDQARAAKLLLDRYKGCAGDIEADRDKKVRPLNDEIAAINAEYKAVHNTDRKKPGALDRVANELRARLTDYLAREEADRIRKAEDARKAAEEAERIARETEQREREAIENAKAGELGVDVTQVVVAADSSFAAFLKADRDASRAERDTNVRIGGGFGKAASLRSVETLSLTDPVAALQAVGVTEKITDAILSAARDFRKQNGSLPAGVTSAITRQV